MPKAAKPRSAHARHSLLSTSGIDASKKRKATGTSKKAQKLAASANMKEELFIEKEFVENSLQKEPVKEDVYRK